MRYEAEVTPRPGKTRHFVLDDEVTDRARRIAIKEQDGMFYLFRLDANGNCIADTVHFSYYEAKRQVEWEYDRTSEIVAVPEECDADTTRWYYPGNCPACGPDGEMLICKRADGKFIFCCAECFGTCDRPEDIEAGEGHIDLDVVVGSTIFAPTREEIEAHGWGEYCVHVLIENDPWYGDGGH